MLQEGALVRFPRSAAHATLPLSLFARAVVVELREVGFLSGGDIVGTLRYSLHRLMDQGCILGEQAAGAGMARGDGGRPATVEVEIRWVGTFG